MRQTYSFYFGCMVWSVLCICSMYNRYLICYVLNIDIKYVCAIDIYCSMVIIIHLVVGHRLGRIWSAASWTRDTLSLSFSFVSSVSIIIILFIITLCGFTPTLGCFFTVLSWIIMLFLLFRAREKRFSTLRRLLSSTILRFSWHCLYCVHYAYRCPPTILRQMYNCIIN